jgi:F0F1-type ATP synthase epsilon subunit
VEAQAALDKAAVDRRAGRASDVDREAARTALSQAQDRLKQQKTELRRIEADASTPRPNVADG